MTIPELKRCDCGWERPLISVTTFEGPPAPENVIPVYSCPRCGKGYVATECPPHVARRVLRELGKMAQSNVIDNRIVGDDES